MIVIRPIERDDLSALMQIAEESGVGFTSLPVDETILRNKIEHSIASFEDREAGVKDRYYLMVAEDTHTGEVVGTTGLEAAVGMSDAFYNYHLGKAVHSSAHLQVHNIVETLTLSNDLTGCSELCTLFLREGYRQGMTGRLLSRCRFLFLAEFQRFFGDRVIAEMRGVSDKDGHSPFWQWLEEHFFSLDFPTADYLTGVGNKQFIAELMPKHPIYVTLLSQEAQAVIGDVHEKTRPALRLLEKEGFLRSSYVDIFDAGPAVECRINQIHTVQESQRFTVRVGTPSTERQQLISNTQYGTFRAVCAYAELQQDSLVIDETTARQLEVETGDWVRAVDTEILN